MTTEKSDSQTVREYLRNQLSGLVFRRAHASYASPADTVAVEYVTHKSSTPLTSYEIFTQGRSINGTKHPFTAEEKEKNVVYYHSSFYFETTGPLVTDDPFPEDFITGRPENYALFRSADCSFVFADENVGTMIAPRPGDMICGRVACDGNLRPYFEKWCIVSEQFFRMASLILYNNIYHPRPGSVRSRFSPTPKGSVKITEDLPAKPEDPVRKYTLDPKNRVKDLLQYEKRYYMRGNKLTPNTFLKYSMYCQQNNLEFTEEKKTEMFYSLRYRDDGLHYIHLYNAIVLLARYGEYPSTDNIPCNKGDKNHEGYSLKDWHLPDEFIQNLIKTARENFA